MGFERKKIYKLEWPEDSEFAGLEARVKAANIRDYLALMAVLVRDAPDTYEDDDGSWQLKGNIEQQFAFCVKKFAKSLVSWNLEEDGVPVPADEEGLYAQDRDFVLAMIRAWTDALASVSPPLEVPSPAGTQSAVESIPMEPLSESLAS